jgi:hypothetical protein
MSYKCEFCNKELKTVSSLNNHKKTAKYCLDIQNKVNINYKCSKCNKILSSKQSLENHKLICITNNVEDLKNKITDLENKNLKLQTSLEDKNNIIKDKDNLIKDLQDRLERIASKPTTSTTNNNNTNNINVTFNIDKSDIENNLTKYDKNYIVDGLKGVAAFYAKEVFPKEDGKYICYDKSRNIFKYKDKDGNIHKDPNCTKLIEITQPIIKDKLDKTYVDYEQQIQNFDKNKDKDKKIIDNKYALKYYQTETLKTKLEVVDMHKNNKFANHLSNYLTI